MTTFGLGWCIPRLECVGDIAFGTHRLGQKCVLFGRRKKARTHAHTHAHLPEQLFVYFELHFTLTLTCDSILGCYGLDSVGMI